MKNRKLFIALISGIVLSMSGIASAQTGWAVENGDWAKCPAGEAAYTLNCQGDYCAEISSSCDNLGVFIFAGEVETGWFSDPNGRAECPDGYAVNGFRTQGWDGYGDNVQLSCVRAEGKVHDACEWSDWISEENPNPYTPPAGGAWNVPANYVNTGSLHYIAGMECDGAYCDNMRIKSCNFIDPPAIINLGGVNTQTPFSSAGMQAVEITDFTHDAGWAPTKIVIGISTTAGLPLDGALWIDGVYYDLSAQNGGWYTQIEVDYVDGITTQIYGLFEGVSVPFLVDWWFSG